MARPALNPRPGVAIAHQARSLCISANRVDVLNTAPFNSVTNVINPVNGAVFYRLVYSQPKGLRDSMDFVLGKIMFQLSIV
jgi:hypothetical protein